MRIFFWSLIHRLAQPQNARTLESLTFPFSYENKRMTGVYGTLPLCKEPRKWHMAIACKPCCITLSSSSAERLLLCTFSE